jgi:outer membrane protein assembly factor BamD
MTALVCKALWEIGRKLRALSARCGTYAFNLTGGLRRLSMVGIMVASFSGCSTTDPPDHTIGWSPEKLYAEAKDELSVSNFAQAIKLLEKLEARHPFSRWSEQAQLDIAYAHYRDGERVLALATLDRFQKLYPNHPALDYVLYLRGLVNFNERIGILSMMGGQDIAERDLKAVRDAFDAFRTLTTRFPDSKYAEDAQARSVYLVNAMASGEVSVARYYYRRGAYVAAANRAQGVIRQYQQAPAVEEALQILVQSYDRLGMTELRDDAKRVLEKNFPASGVQASAQTERRWWQVWR